jgi:type IV pilus assembly protein PilY1
VKKTNNPAPSPAVTRALRSTAAGFLLAVACLAPAMADDTEIFVNQQTSAAPNLLLIIDTSGSMSTPVPGRTGDPGTNTGTYDPTRVYDAGVAGCVRDRIYWRRDDGTDLTCSTAFENWIDISAFRCDEGLKAIAQNGRFLADGAGQWNPTTQKWVGLDTTVKSQPVECAADAGKHGESASDPRTYAANSAQWTENKLQAFNYSSDGTDRFFVFYSGNYVHFASLPQRPPDPNDPTRLQVVQQAAVQLIQSLSGVNVGLMRFSSNGLPPDSNEDDDRSSEGGMVLHAVAPVESSRTSLINSINGLSASGETPLSETFYEAYRYLSGGPVDYGLNSRTGGASSPLTPSVGASRVQPEGTHYKSPIESACQKNYIVYLSDGDPRRDANGEARIQGATGLSTCDGTGEGRCLDDLAGFMFTNDVRADGVGGKQTVTTYTVGFGDQVSGSTLLRETARRGGGEMFAANDGATLSQTFNSILERIRQGGRTFAAPTVAVNSFNRTETLADLYVSVFEPGDRYHWDGNLKKYQFLDGRIADANERPAVDASGFFENTSRSIWSPGTDGADVRLGGAASRIPDPANRRVFTFLGNDANLAASENRLATTNSLLTPHLGIGQPGDPSLADLVNWALGFDVRDEDNDAATTLRKVMGDPLHGRPTIVVYGGTAAAPDTNDAVVFVPTNDGYLHAIDVATGTELWAFIPRELLSRLTALFRNDPSDSKHYGLDADVRSFRTDSNRNGIVDGGDKVYLFFGMGRGGSNYYALDVTNKNSPRHLWTLGPTQLPGVGQTWSTPVVTRVNVRNGPAQNADKLVLVLGGGYDETQDNDSATSLYNTDSVGNRIFIVDAVNGSVLWIGGGPGVRADERNLGLARMTNSIPAAVRVIDLDGDSFGDRMYVGDTGGRLWRFDIIVDADLAQAGIQVPDASQLVTGGVMASLGNADDATHPIESTRRFYHSPDVAFIQRRNSDSFLSVSIGSGWRGHPLDTRIRDRFYSVRDYQPFTKFTQAEYGTRPVLTDGDLTDITDIDTGSIRVGEGKPGWRLELRLPGGFTGEKVLAESRTFNNAVLFPTYLPQGGTAGCGPLGGNRVYAVSVLDGQPIIDINRDGRTEPSDRYTDLAQGGIAPEVSFFFLPKELQGGTGGGGQGTGDPNRRPVLCSVGLEVLPNLCRDAGTAVRTYWRRNAQ